ncbi:MAG: Rrf2 family transcriptional regulator [Clostridia bacterium]|nr:Rrf2 family transcriptional regulator [Clostridia bacterium]
MKISTKGRYALRMMLDIEEHQKDGYVALKDIAARQEISKKYLEQIALHLSQCGMLRAVRGYQGGYMLARAAKDYKVAEILAAVEGTLAPVSCLESPVNECPRREGCKTLPLWTELSRVIMDYLESMTLEDLAEGRVKPQ